MKELEDKKLELLDTLGMPDQPHAVKINRGYSNMLLRVNSPLALIRWLPISKDKEKGLGYYLYKAGNMRYDSVFREISF